MSNKVRKNFSDNLISILKQKNISQNELARKLGVSSGTVSKWVTKTQYPRDDKLQSIADVLHVPLSELTSFDTQNREKSDTLVQTFNKLNSNNQNKVLDYSKELLDDQEHPKTKLVPVLGEVAANPDGIQMNDGFEEYIEAPKNADATLIINGDSMEPKFHNGEPVFYKFQNHIENGEYAIVAINNEDATLKQIKFDYQNRKIILHSLNAKYDDRILEPNEVRILGKVVL